MLENSTSSENTAAPAQNRPAEDGGASGPDSDGLKDQPGLADQEVDRNSAGHRWPREETLALLKIRSEMDIAFRDISPKGPLWQQVSRKLAGLGYHRSAKKCKEKFENIYKYHRRTKEGRYGRPNRKTYRFFEQLEALDAHLLFPSPTSAEKDQTPNTTTPLDVIQHAMPCSTRFLSANNNSITSSSNEESPKKKSKLTKFFQGLMKEVLEKQETLQKNFMEVLEKCEQDRIAREEAWRTQELARLNRERELLAQERSAAAAKDAALIAFLKKVTEQSQSACPVQLPENIPVDHRNLIPDDIDKNKQEKVNGGCNVSVTDKQECGNVGNFIQMSSSRWPKEEVDALIRLRTNLEVEYEGNNNGPKGPLWEEISSAMKKLGYDRSAKRCKEKWENINKYFKRMKQKNKRKPEDSKTCPYFHQLDELYSKKPRKVQESAASGNELKAEELLMHIMSGQEERQSSEDADREKTNQIEGDKEEVDQMVDSNTSTAIMS